MPYPLPGVDTTDGIQNYRDWFPPPDATPPPSYISVAPPYVDLSRIEQKIDELIERIEVQQMWADYDRLTREFDRRR
jgi:hypothetical protein